MPWTLYRYILKDILKLLLISTLALVTVISFAVAIKPLSEGLLDVGGLFKFVLATAPTMLVYALPFSAAFAVTLTFSRLTGDNEITACSASGLSYVTVLLPVFALGGVLMLFVFIASNWVLPGFTRTAMDLVQKDIMRVLVYQLRKGEPVVLSDYKIYANQAEEVPAPHIEGSEIQPDQLILLRGVAVGRLDQKTHRTRSDHTAEEADILVFRDEGRTWVQFRLKNALYHDEVTGNPFLSSTAVGAEAADMLPNIELPSRFRDKTKAMTFGELLALRRNPERHPRVVGEKERLVEVLAGEELLGRLNEGLLRSAQSYGTPTAMGVSLIGAHKEQRYLVSGPAVSRDKDAVVLNGSSDRPALIDVYEGDKLQRRFEARGPVRFEPVAVDGVDEPRIAPMLRDVSIIDPARPDRTTERSDLTLTRLWWPQPVAKELNAMDIGSLVRLVADKYSHVPEATKASYLLYTQTVRMQYRAVSELHERGGAAAACMIATLIGAVLSIYLRGRLPLVVYLWTFLIVLAALLLVQTGARLAGEETRPLFVGIGVLWLSVAGLAAVAGGIYLKMSRN